MSKITAWKPYQQHTYKCEWILAGKKKTCKFIYLGDYFDGLIACYQEVLWAKHPTFKVNQVITKDI